MFECHFEHILQYLISNDMYSFFCVKHLFLTTNIISRK